MTPIDSLILQAIKQAPSPIVVTDRSGVMVYANPKFLAHTGYRPEQVIGQNPRILSAGKTDPKIYAELWQTILDGKVWSGELLNRKATGEIYWESICIGALKGSGNEITHFIGIWQDTTDRKAREDALLRTSITDELTGCYNRRHLMMSIEHELLRARRYRRDLLGLATDIDHFKLINDRLSHAWGDLVLKGFAEIIRSSLRTVDIASRYGGDEFLILLPETPVANARVIAARIQNRFRAFLAEQGIPEDFKVSASFGACALPQAGDISSAAFIEMMDGALLEAKRSGKNAIHILA